MAATATTTTTTKSTPPQAQAQAHFYEPTTTKPKRRHFYEPTTISSSAVYITGGTKLHPLPSPPASPSTTFKISFSPGSASPAMDFNGTTTLTNSHSPSSFTKFNSALTAGLLNPMSPPPPLPHDKSRSSPTLFEMMASEPDIHPRTHAHNQPHVQMPVPAPKPQLQSPLVIDKQTLTLQRISDLLAIRSPGNQFNDQGSSDIKLTLSSKDGISVSISVHRQILVAHSRYFAVKLSDRWARQQRNGSEPYIVEIADCDDVEVYIETLRLMYCKDLRKKLMREDVPKILGILKVTFNFSSLL